MPALWSHKLQPGCNQMGTVFSRSPGTMSAMAAREATQGRVLVVEDDESTALFVTRVLARNGFEASWVTDAEQASERLGREAFDVLLADFRLPGLSGMDLARHTRQSMPSLSIAVMTSFADSHTEQTALSGGADDFFEKPLHSSNFVARIRALVTRSRAAGVRAGSPPARGTPEAGPVESAPEASPRSDASGSPDRCEGGPASPGGPAQASGCERWRDASPREDGSAILARAAHPAPGRLLGHGLVNRRPVGQMPAGREAGGAVLVWASAAPAVSIGSRAGRVSAPRTRPGWSPSW